MTAESCLGSWAAGLVGVIGVAYVVAMGFGFAASGLDRPIGDPVLAVMEVLTLLSAAALVVALAAVHAVARADRKVFAVVSLAFGIAFAGITSAVHFVELTASRQIGIGQLVWPSPNYAAELLAWDWFLGLALMAAAPVFEGRGFEMKIRRGFWLSGMLALVGAIGPVVGDMRLQRIGIVGYAGVLPVVFFMLAYHFRNLAHGTSAAEA